MISFDENDNVKLISTRALDKRKAISTKSAMIMAMRIFELERKLGRVDGDIRTLRLLKIFGDNDRWTEIMICISYVVNGKSTENDDNLFVVIVKVSGGQVIAERVERMEDDIKFALSLDKGR